MAWYTLVVLIHPIAIIAPITNVVVIVAVVTPAIVASQCFSKHRKEQDDDSKQILGDFQHIYYFHRKKNDQGAEQVLKNNMKEEYTYFSKIKNISFTQSENIIFAVHFSSFDAIF